jgi:hypothetical protein
VADLMYNISLRIFSTGDYTVSSILIPLKDPKFCTVSDTSGDYTVQCRAERARGKPSAILSLRESEDEKQWFFSPHTFSSFEIDRRVWKWDVMSAKRKSVIRKRISQQDCTRCFVVCHFCPLNADVTFHARCLYVYIRHWPPWSFIADTDILHRKRQHKFFFLY